MIDRIRYFISDCHVPYRNLAIEEYLLRAVQPGECILYLWQNRHTVVVGKNQNARKECKVDLLQAEEGLLVRRLSGGGAVYHDLGNLNFTFLVREADYDVNRQLSVIVKALEEFGVKAEQTGRNDVVAEGRKFSGNAFYQSGDFCYHHGTLLVKVDMENLSRYLNVSLKKMQSKGVNSVKSRVINLSELNPEITVDTLKPALIHAFERVYSCTASEIKEDELNAVQIAEREKHFGSDEWKYGMLFSYTGQLEERFSWGEIQIHFRVNGREVEETKIYSDAMDEAFIPLLEEGLRNIPFNASSLIRAVDGVEADTELRAVMKADVIRLLSQQL